MKAKQKLIIRAIKNNSNVREDEHPNLAWKDITNTHTHEKNFKKLKKNNYKTKYSR